MLTDEQFDNGFGILGSAYPEYVCTPQTIEVYRVALRTLQPEEFEKAVWAHINLHKWFPKVAEIKEQVLRLRNQGRPTAPERWGQLIIAAERGEDAPTDPATERALRIFGGWEKFGYTSLEELGYRRRDFERVYTEALEEQDRQVLLGLEGTPEQKQVTHEP